MINGSTSYEREILVDTKVADFPLFAIYWGYILGNFCIYSNPSSSKKKKICFLLVGPGHSGQSCYVKRKLPWRQCAVFSGNIVPRTWSLASTCQCFWNNFLTLRCCTICFPWSSVTGDHGYLVRSDSFWSGGGFNTVFFVQRFLFMDGLYFWSDTGGCHTSLFVTLRLFCLHIIF